MTEIWVCSTGEYENRYTFGAWRSVERAVAGVKEMYQSPYIVQWQEPTTDKFGTHMTGHFAAVSGKSTQHTAFFDFEPWELED